MLTTDSFNPLSEILRAARQAAHRPVSPESCGDTLKLTVGELCNLIDDRVDAAIRKHFPEKDREAKEKEVIELAAKYGLKVAVQDVVRQAA